jgi:hypothetical protein
MAVPSSWRIDHSGALAEEIEAAPHVHNPAIVNVVSKGSMNDTGLLRRCPSRRLTGRRREIRRPEAVYEEFSTLSAQSGRIDADRVVTVRRAVSSDGRAPDF